MFYYLYISMKKNKLIVSQKQAAKILLTGNSAALNIPNNEPRLYIIEDVLCWHKISTKVYPVWAVKTGKYSYTGALIRSGITDEEGNWVNAVRVDFYDMNIVKTIQNGDFVTPYIQAEANFYGIIILTTRLMVFSNWDAKTIIKENFPDAASLPVVMVRATKWIQSRYKCSSFWAVKTPEGDYITVSPYSGKCRFMPAKNILATMLPGERFDDNYRLVHMKNHKNLMLWRIKKEVS